MLASPSSARNGAAIASAENVAAAAPELAPFAQRVRRFGKCAAGVKKCGGAAGLLSPVSVSKKPAATASRRRMGSLSTRCSTPAPRAPLRELTEEDRTGEVRANLSSPFDEAGRGRCQERPGGGGEAAASRKRTARGVGIEEAMAGIPEGRVKYLVDTFERLLSLAGGGGGPEARTKGGRIRRTKSEVTSGQKKREVTPAARASSSASSPTPAAAAPEEIDVSYPSSEVSFPAIAGVACILDASDRTRFVPYADQSPKFGCSAWYLFLTQSADFSFLPNFSMIRAAREQRRLRRFNVSGAF